MNLKGRSQMQNDKIFINKESLKQIYTNVMKFGGETYKFSPAAPDKDDMYSDNYPYEYTIKIDTPKKLYDFMDISGIGYIDSGTLDGAVGFAIDEYSGDDIRKSEDGSYTITKRGWKYIHDELFDQLIDVDDLSESFEADDLQDVIKQLESKGIISNKVALNK